MGLLVRLIFHLLLSASLAFGGWQDDMKPKMSLDKDPDDGAVVFYGNASSTDFFKLFVPDGNNVLIGARNAVYNVTADSLQLNHKLEWYSEEEDVQMCLTKGKDIENCQNYIRILNIVGPGKILVCGTNAYKPRCRTYQLGPNGYVQGGNEKSGQGICPYDPRHNSTSTVVDGDVYAGTVADFAEVDPLIHRWDSLRTPQYDLKYLNAPNYVSSMEYKDFVFFFFRETSEEFTNCGKAVFSRVGRVCKGDRGFPRGAGKTRWTTFFKARLNCSVPGEFPFPFDEIQSLSLLLPKSQLGDEVVYGVFTTSVNSLPGSAICSFKMRDILDVFDGRFKAQQGANTHWLPVPADKVPEPRPGLCVNDSTTLPDQYYYFVSGHTFMDEPVQPILGRPLLTRALANYRLTTIAVTNTSGLDGRLYDVIFIGTDDGKVLSLVNTNVNLSNDKEVGMAAPTASTGAQKLKSVLTMESQVFKPKSPVREMRFVGNSNLLVGSDKTLKLINVRQCFTGRVRTCGECIGMQNPFCAWHKADAKCVPLPLTFDLIKKREYLQNVLLGTHPECAKQRTNPVAFGGPEQIIGKNNPDFDRDEDEEEEEEKVKEEDEMRNRPKETADVRRRLNSNDDLVVIGPRRGDSYTAETLSIAVGVGCVLAILLGFVAGWGCSRRCKKDHDNIPYPDTDYEYFEQRHNLNINSRLVGEGKEEATYAEPVVLDGKNMNNVNHVNVNQHQMQMNLQPDINQETTMFHFAQPYSRDLYRFEGEMNSSRGLVRPGEAFGSLRPSGLGMDGYGTAHRNQLQQNNKGMIPNITDGYGTSRSVKKVYL